MTKASWRGRVTEGDAVEPDLGRELTGLDGGPAMPGGMPVRNELTMADPGLPLMSETVTNCFILLPAR